MSSTFGENRRFDWHPDSSPSKIHIIWKLVIALAVCGVMGWTIGIGSEQETGPMMPAATGPPPVVTSSAAPSPPAAPAVTLLNGGASNNEPKAEIEGKKALAPVPLRQRPAAESSIPEKGAPDFRALRSASNYEDLRRQMLEGH